MKILPPVPEVVCSYLESCINMCTIASTMYLLYVLNEYMSFSLFAYAKFTRLILHIHKILHYEATLHRTMFRSYSRTCCSVCAPITAAHCPMTLRGLIPFR